MSITGQENNPNIAPNIHAGVKVDTNLFRSILNYIKTRIRFGDGFNVTTYGDQIVVSLAKKGGGVGGISSDTLKRVPHLPQVDVNLSKNAYQKVFWLSYDTGLEEGYDDADGDDGVWTLVFPQQRWYPEQKYTPNSGIPISL